LPGPAKAGNRAGKFKMGGSTLSGIRQSSATIVTFAVRFRNFLNDQNIGLSAQKYLNVITTATLRFR
jgi:hypothetical protein